MQWREITLKNKIAKMYFKRRILRNWQNYVYTRNYVLPV